MPAANRAPFPAIVEKSGDGFKNRPGMGSKEITTNNTPLANRQYGTYLSNRGKLNQNILIISTIKIDLRFANLI